MKLASFRFRTHLWVFLGFLSLILLGTYFSLSQYGEKDLEAYHALISAADIKAENDYTTTQPRMGVQKDLHFMQGENRLKAVLKGDKARLVFDHHEGKTEIVEEIEHACCIMQEGLISDVGRPVQMICILEAEHANYHHQRGILVAEMVEMCRYVVPGHQFPEHFEGNTCIMEGTANHLVLSLSGPGVQLRAELPRVISRDFSDEISMESISVVYDGNVITLTGDVVVEHAFGRISAEEVKIDQRAHKAYGTDAYLYDPLGDVYADTFEIAYEDAEGPLNIQEIKLVGNVKLMNRKKNAAAEEEPYLQYALADEVCFYPTTKRVKMRAGQQKRRVLFYDQANGVQVSAPGLTIIRDPETGKDKIQGEGDVRFKLAEHELERLKNRFFSERNEDNHGN